MRKFLLMSNTYYYLIFFLISYLSLPSIYSNQQSLFRRKSQSKYQSANHLNNDINLNQNSYNQYYKHYHDEYDDDDQDINNANINEYNYYQEDNEYEYDDTTDIDTFDEEYEDDDELSDYTLYFHEYEMDWDNPADWEQDDDYAKQNVPHACSHTLEIIDHKLCVVGNTLKEAKDKIKDIHREVSGSPPSDRKSGFVLNFKKKNGKESFNMKHINSEEMVHLWKNRAHPHILTREELDQAMKQGKLNQFGNTFSVTYHGMVFDFTKDKDWKKINAHHNPRYMDNHHVRPKVVQNNDPAPQIQDQLDEEWRELDHYNHFVRENSYPRKRYLGPDLIIPPGTQNVVKY